MKVIYPTLGKYQYFLDEFIELFNYHWGATEVIMPYYGYLDNNTIPQNFNPIRIGFDPDDGFTNGFNDKLITILNDNFDDDDIVILLTSDMFTTDFVDLDEISKIESMMKTHKLDRVGLSGYMDEGDEDPDLIRQKLHGETTLAELEFMDINGDMAPFMHPALWKVSFLKYVLTLEPTDEWIPTGETIPPNILGCAEMGAIQKIADNTLSTGLYQSSRMVVNCFDICENGKICNGVANFIDREIEDNFVSDIFYRAVCKFAFTSNMSHHTGDDLGI